MNKDFHDQAAQELAKGLEVDGYRVQIEPPPEAIPFDLEGYRPDLLAARGNENLIIEVKTNPAPRNLERYKRVSDIIAGHPGWRFMISTINPDIANDRSDLISIPSRDDILQMLRRLEPLIQSENHEFAIPHLWSVLMSGMRIAAFQNAVPVDFNSDLRVLNYMYSLGRLSYENYQVIKSYFDLRNRVAHSLITNVSVEEVREFHSFVRKMLSEWGIIQEN